MFDVDITLARMGLAIVMLGIATIIDIKKREIHDSLWLVFGGISVILLIFEPNLENALVTVGFSLIVAPFVLLVWRFGLFGGADALGIIVLASLAPMLTLSENMVTPFTVVLNSALLSVIPLLFNFIKNLISLAKNEDIFEGFNESQFKKIFAMFIGFKAKNPKYCFSIEQTIDNEKKLDLRIQNSDKTEFCSKSNSWVTIGLPYMMFIFGGFLIQLFFGDIFFMFSTILS